MKVVVLVGVACSGCVTVIKGVGVVVAGKEGCCADSGIKTTMEKIDTKIE
jgi:hypothetical protein